jgi:hypothetical protein
MAEKIHEFTLTTGTITEMTPELAEALYEAGCDDATVGMSNGVFEATFHREGATFSDAVMSAILDIKRAIPGAGWWALDHNDLVSQSDIARRIGKTRATVSLYAAGKRTPSGKRDLSSFPTAVTESYDGPLYSWADVADWLRAHGLMSEEEALDAWERKRVAAALDFAHLRRTPEMAAKMDRIVALAGPGSH